MNDVKKIMNLDLHDSPVKGIKFNFEDKTLALVLQKWDEDSSVYVEFEFLFINVSSFQTNEFEVNHFLVEDLISLEIEENPDGLNSAKAIFNLGHGQPVWIITISFGEIKLK